MSTEQPTLRRATADDVAGIAGLTDAAYSKYIAEIGRKPQPMTTDYAPMVRDHPVWVLEIEQQLAGVLVLQHEAENMLIYSVAIAPEYQKRGLGRLLLAHAEQQARQAGYDVVRLYTNGKMEANIALYSRLGYRETGRETYPGGTVVHMTKQLTADEVGA